MKFAALLSLNILLIIAFPLQARWMTKAESGSVIEKFNFHFEVAKDGTWSQEVDYVVRVQAEEAKTNVSLFNIEYNAMTDTVEVIEAYTLNGKTRINVEKAAIEDRDKGESRDYDVQKVRSILYPQVQIGSRLFVRYKIKTSKPIVKDTWSNMIGVSPSYYVESFNVKINSERPLYFELKDPRNLLKVNQPSKNKLVVSNRRDLPGWVHAEKDPYFHPGGNTELMISTESSWPKFIADLASGYEKIIDSEVPANLRPWIAAAKKLKTPEEQILFLMEKMSKDFRYFGDWRRNDGGFVPRLLTEIEKSRYGDCKDLSTVLTSMLRQLKMDANVALVRRGENPYVSEPDYVLPVTSRFNHAIVRAKAGDKTYWLDPTNPVSSLTPFPDISGRPSWVLRKEGGEFDRLPAAQAKDFVHIHNYEYRFKSQDSVLVEVKASLEKMAPYHIASDLMLSPRSQVLSDTLEYFSEGQEVRSFKYRKEPHTGRTLKDMNVDLEYEAGRVTFSAGASSFWVIPDGFLQGAFYETDQRESDLRLGQQPYFFRGVRRLKQTKLAQDIPAVCRVDSPWMSLERNVKVDGQDVVIVQDIELKRPYIQRAEFRSRDFKRLQEETKKCFHRSGLLIEPLNRPLSSNANVR